MDRDYRQAAGWFEQAARQGDPEAQNNLGVIYANGLGIEKDLKKAYLWFALATAGGNAKASKARDSVQAKLDPLELVAAEKLVAEWQPVYAIELTE